MTIRRRLPWLMCVTAMLLLLLDLWLGVLNHRLDRDVLVSALFIGIIVGYSAVGAMLASRNPSNAIGWLMLVVGLALGLSALAPDPDGEDQAASFAAAHASSSRSGPNADLGM